MNAKIAVIIPHYQRKPGVLARTLAAVFAQEDAPPFRVIIVDDESPAPAAAELGELDDAARAAIQIVPRKNGGPAAAKNTGLAAMPPEVEFVALLDCDDIWHPRHLARGMAAMDQGCDLFFGDHRREQTQVTHFSAYGMDPREHVPLEGAPALYRWSTNLFDTCLRIPTIALSTTIFRRARYPDLKFAGDVGLADDYWFAIEVTNPPSIAAVSFLEEALYTVADNVSVITDWRSNKSLRVILAIALCYVKLLKTYPLSGENLGYVRQRLREARTNFAVTALSLLYRERSVEWSYVGQFMRADPALAGAFAAALFRAIPKLFSGSR